MKLFHLSHVLHIQGLFKGPYVPGVTGLATVYVLLITLQLLFMVKSQVVVTMDKQFRNTCYATITNHLVSLCGSALVTVAMSP